ncbi:hypothetical protein [Chamaesiphon sp. OTE_8_metabat_110]|nr:hypothetical protein [Chamaesiphon sp. OTE_8_metabat_110]
MLQFLLTAGVLLITMIMLLLELVAIVSYRLNRRFQRAQKKEDLN